MSKFQRAVFSKNNGDKSKMTMKIYFGTMA